MRFLTFSLLLLFFGFSIRAFAQEKPQIKEKLSPPTPVELTQEEKDWWKAVEAAASEATRSSKEVETLIADFKEKFPDSIRSEAISRIPPEAVRNLKEAKEKYYGLLAQGVEKKFRTSVESSRPKALSAPSPGYTKEGRASRVCGTVTVRTEIAANGVPLSANVLKSIQKRCPTLSEAEKRQSPQEPISENPPSLGQGLEEVAISTALEILFFPAIENHHLVKSKAKIEINFNIY
jgi:hypothetical protein